jgi:site-specific recombinase XerD
MKATRLSLWEQNSEIREVFTLWLEALEARGVAPRTLENYRDRRRSEFVAFLEPHATTLDAVQPHHIRKWLIHKQRKGVSPHTVRNAYRLPRLFWNGGACERNSRRTTHSRRWKNPKYRRR